MSRAVILPPGHRRKRGPLSGGARRSRHVDPHRIMRLRGNLPRPAAVARRRAANRRARIARRANRPDRHAR